MAYIGKTPTIGNFQVCDAISVVNNQAAYTMQVGGVNVSPESANHMLVSLNGILQAPTSSFTVSGSTITFASNLVTGDVIDFIQILGNVLDLGVPSDNTVSLAKLTATGTKDATTFLRGDNSFQEVPAGGITEVDRFLMVDASYSSGSTLTNWSRHNTSYTGVPHGTGMSSSAGIWTFPSTGVYEITIMTYLNNGTTTRQYVGIDIKGTNDAFSSNTTSLGLGYGNVNTSNDHDNLFVQGIYDVTNTSNNKLKFVTDSDGSCGFYTTIATFKKLMET